MARKLNTTHVISPTSLEFFCRNSIFLKDKDRRSRQQLSSFIVFVTHFRWGFSFMARLPEANPRVAVRRAANDLWGRI